MVKVYIVNAFTKNGKGGNPAGVCLDAGKLSITDRKHIAKAMNLSETAFVEPSEKADVLVRFFTPIDEIPLCGHATIATFHLLRELRKIKSGIRKMETLTRGIREISLEENGLLYMSQLVPENPKRINPPDVLSWLGIDGTQLKRDLEIMIYDTGVPTLLIPMRDRESLKNLKPDMKGVEQFEIDHGNCVVYAFSLQTQEPGSSAHGRMFAPAHGITEESATGVANGALACYLFDHRVVDGSNVIKLEQGYTMGKPSEILARIKYAGRELTNIEIGGLATVVGEKEIELKQ